MSLQTRPIPREIKNCASQKDESFQLMRKRRGAGPPGKRAAYSLIASSLVAGTTAALGEPQIIPVWPGLAPGSENWTQKEEVTALPQIGGGRALVRNVTHPTLTAFLPNSGVKNRPGIIVCPGGGFRFLSWETEGTEIAKWLSGRGIAAFVLKYRLVDTGPTQEDFRKSVTEFLTFVSKIGMAADGARGGLPEPMREIAPLAIADARQAISVLRRRAAELNLNENRIGVLGFSAGALITMGVLREQAPGGRPNFAATIYGAAMGEMAAPPPEATPLFILCANDDPIASPGSATAYSKWKAASYPVELHIYAKGGHGFSMNRQGLPTDHWLERFGDWLEEQDLISARPAGTKAPL